MGTFGDGGIRKCVESRCVYVGWPALWFAYLRPNMMRTFWHGSLLEDKQDATGTQFRRNRYYDPATGRFTQEDPIGLAGGLNLYGFGNGDPVNFSDPFGLRVCSRSARIRTAIGVAVGAEIKWDEGGCVSNLDDVKFTGDERTSLQESFATMVSNDAMFTVDWSPDGRAIGIMTTCSQARNDIFDFTEKWYNRQRRYPSLGYLCPARCEEQLRLKASPA